MNGKCEIIFNAELFITFSFNSTDGSFLTKSSNLITCVGIQNNFTGESQKMIITKQ